MKTAVALAVLVCFALAVLVGGWALMMTAALLGVSVPFWNAVVAFLLIRLFILPTPSVSTLKEHRS